MFLVSGPRLVAEACKAGVMGAIPRQNVRSLDEFEHWLATIRAELDDHAQRHRNARIGPLAVNLATGLDAPVLARHLDVLDRYGVRVVISAMGNPSQLIERVHERGGLVYCDVTSLRHAQKAADAGADGLTCIGSGGGGHSGTINHLALIPRIRKIFGGTIIAAGAIADGAAIRACEILGADLAYLGTRFIATQESLAAPEYKRMLVEQSSSGLRYTAAVSGVAANWLVASMRDLDLNPDELPVPRGVMRHDHLPDHVRPWKNLWSAGQGIELIEDLPTVADLVARLRVEYVAACRIPDYADSVRADGEECGGPMGD